MVAVVKQDPAAVKVAPALEALATQADNMAAPVEGDGQQPAPAAAEQPAPGNFEAIAFLLAGFRVVFSQVTGTQSLHRTLDDQKVHACATVLAPVADKYGFQLGGYLGGPEGTALMVAGPILWSAAAELRAELAARKRKPEKLEAAPAAAPAPAAPEA